MENKNYFEYAKKVYGEGIICKSEIDANSDSICELLSIYGEQALCDCVVEGEINKRKFSFSYLVKVYKSEWRKKISDWGFTGCVLKIEDREIKETAFGYCGKIFNRMISSDMVKNFKIRDFSVYSFREQLSVETENQVKRYREWIEDELCYYFSCVYVISMKPGVVEIIFKDPDLNPVEDELEFVEEVLRTCLPYT